MSTLTDSEADTSFINDVSRPCYLNGPLTYIATVLNNSTVDNISAIVCNFYTNKEICKAKKLLWQIAAKMDVDIGEFHERRNSEKRTHIEANVYDVINALKIFDKVKKMPPVAAGIFDKLPLRHPEELNLLCISQRLNRLETTLACQTSAIVKNCADIATLRMNKCRESLNSLSDDVFSSSIKKKRKNKESDNKDINKINEVKTAINCNEANNNKTAVNDNDENINCSETTVDNDNNKRSARDNSVASSECSMANTTANSDAVENIEKMIDKYYDNGTSYSEALKSNTDNFTVVESKKSKRNKKHNENAFKGASANNDIQFTGKTQDNVELFLYKIQSGNAEVINKYFLDKNIRLLYVKKVSNMEAKYMSFKISCYKSDVKHIYKKGFLPNGVSCKYWREPNSKFNGKN